MPVSGTFHTVSVTVDPPTTSPSKSEIPAIGAAFGGVYGGIALIIVVTTLVLICIFSLKSGNSSPKDNQKKKSSLKKKERSKRSVGRDEIYDDPSEADAVQMQPSPAYATIHAVRQSNLDTYRVTIVPSPAYQDWCMRI